MENPKVLSPVEFHKLIKHFHSLKNNDGSRYIVAIDGMNIMPCPRSNHGKTFYAVFNIINMEKAKDKEFSRAGLLFDGDKCFYIDTDLNKHEIVTIRLEKKNYICIALKDYPIYLRVEIAKISNVSTIALNKFFNA